MTRSTLRLVIATIDSLCALWKVEAYDVRAGRVMSRSADVRTVVKSRIVHSIVQPFDVDTSVRSTRRTRALEECCRNRVLRDLLKGGRAPAGIVRAYLCISI